MPEHVHVHAPHELTEESRSHTRRERALEFVAVLLLSISTLAIAWSGYQAARWSGHQSRDYAAASTARALANRASTLAGQERIQDLLDFNCWLETQNDGQTELADLYVRRFRPVVPTYRAWIAQDPLHNEDAIATPLLMPQYELGNFVISSIFLLYGIVHVATLPTL